MATHVSCPLCHTTLRIPEGCEGQTSKCPSCLADFVIPHASNSGPPALVCAVVVEPAKVPQAVPLASTVSEADVAHAAHETQELAADDIVLSIQLAELERLHRRQANRLKSLQFFRSGRTALDHSVGRIGGFFLTVTLGPSLLIVAISVFSPSVNVYVLFAMLGTILSAIAYLPFSFFPDDEKLLTMIDSLTARVHASSLMCQEVARDEAEARRRMRSAETEHRRLRASLESQTGAAKSKDPNA